MESSVNGEEQGKRLPDLRRDVFDHRFLQRQGPVRNCSDNGTKELQERKRRLS